VIEKLSYWVIFADSGAEPTGHLLSSQIACIDLRMKNFNTEIEGSSVG
jgi:hypothetical protein